MRALQGVWTPAAATRLRVLVVIVSLAAIVVAFVTADTAYDVAASSVPSVAIASIAAAVAGERDRRRANAQDRAISRTSGRSAAVPEAVVRSGETVRA